MVIGLRGSRALASLSGKRGEGRSCLLLARRWRYHVRYDLGQWSDVISVCCDTRCWRERFAMIEMHGAGRSIVGCCHRDKKGWVSVALPVQLVGQI